MKTNYYFTLLFILLFAVKFEPIMSQVDDGSIAKDSEKNTSIKASGLRLLSPPVCFKPEIDGKIEFCWERIDPISIKDSFQLESPSINSASWRAMWDDSFLYIFVEVDDNSLNIGEAVELLPGRTTSFDKPEIYLDVNTILKDSLGPGSGDVPSHSYKGHYFIDPIIKPFESGIELPIFQYDNSTYAFEYNPAKANYTIEYAISYKDLIDKNGKAFTPELMTEIGFDINISDSDIIDTDEGVVVSARQRAVWANTGKVAYNWFNMDDSGIIRFTNRGIIQANTALNCSFFATVTWGSYPLKVTFVGSTEGFVDDYFWDFGDGNTSSGFSPDHTYNVPGTYTVSFTVSNPTNEKTTTLKDYIIVGTTNIKSYQSPLPEINISPNPVTKEALITYNLEQSSHVVIEVFDLSGKLLHQIENKYFDRGIHTTTFNTSETPDGVYLIKMGINNTCYTRKLIVKH